MKIINREQVSHIQVYKETEGVHFTWHGFVKHVWMEVDYFHFLWLIKTPLKNYEKGYYRDVKRKWITNDTPFKIEENKHFVVGNSVWTRPFINIFCGKEVIHKQYFQSFEELEQHLKENYSNVNVRYE